jgi:hypothetical protein
MGDLVILIIKMKEALKFLAESLAPANSSERND